MSDLEIIEAMRLSHPILSDTPVDILSIIARYSRPNIYIFIDDEEPGILEYRCLTKELLVRVVHTEQISYLVKKIHHIIGTVGDTLYFLGIDHKGGHILFSFDLSSHIFTYWCKVPNSESVSVSSDGYLYGYEGGGTFYRLDPITSAITRLPNMIFPKDGCECFFHDNSIYAIGGTTEDLHYTANCQRFDISENKWYTIAPLPTALNTMTITVKDGTLVITSMREDEKVFIYSMIENKWTTEKRSKDFAKFSLETLEYNRGTLYALSIPERSTPYSIVWERTEQPRQWIPIFEMAEEYDSDQKAHIHLHLTEKGK